MTPQNSMSRNPLRAGALVSVSALLLFVAACSGSDEKTSPADTGTQDHTASTEQTIDHDAATDAPIGDSFIWPETGADGSETDIIQPDLGPTTKCSGWPAWKDSCMQKGMMGCQATCANSGLIRKIVCEEDGSCTCQVGTKKTACTAVTPSSTYCQTCVTAFTGGCCMP